MAIQLKPKEILADPANLLCPCEDHECRWHGNCKDCLALHRYYRTVPNCLAAETSEGFKDAVVTLSDSDIIREVKAQLAVDMNCSPGGFDSEGFVFCEAVEHPERRPFPRDATHFQMLTMGGATVVSATPDILPGIREQLCDKSRDEAFSMPFVVGNMYYFYYLPSNMTLLPLPDRVELTVVEKGEVELLYTVPGDFSNALQYDLSHNRPDVLAIVAKVDGVVAGIAGASEDCAMLWQIGVDVLPEYRRHGIAAVMVNRLANEILKRGKVPYYGTSSANIASQRTALKAGMTPAWVVGSSV